MSNAMRSGKRLLAGLASGALVLTGVAIAAAPSASAAQTIAAICTGNSTGVNGDRGTLPDPTSVQPNCSVVAGVGIGNAAPFNESVFGAAAGNTWYQFTITGDSTFLAGTSVEAGQIIAADGKTIWAPEAAVDGDTSSFGMQVPTAGTRTVSVSVSTTASGTVPAANTFSDAGTFTVTGIGAATQAVVSQGYYAVSQFNATSDDSAALAIVHVVDSAGALVNLAGSSVSNLTYTATGGTITTGLYTNNDCSALGTLNAYDPGNLDAPGTASMDIVTDACEITVGAGVRQVSNSGLWVFWDAAAATGSAAGSYTATFTLTTASGASFPVTVNYVVSSPVAAAWTWTLDKGQYLPGGTAALTVTARDAGGRIVPDGLGWDKVSPATSGTWLRNLLNNGVVTNAPIYAPTGGAAINPSAAFKVAASGTQATISTYNGATGAAFSMPASSMEAFVIAGENTTENGWAVVAQETTKSATARIGNPVPPEPATILIEGTRGKGDQVNMVFVEGTTTELVGKTVTPHFRFPGQTGFTAGTGTRTVDAQGNFAWSRKTGKQIAVQFRAGDVKSNTVIIEAK